MKQLYILEHAEDVNEIRGALQCLAALWAFLDMKPNKTMQEEIVADYLQQLIPYGDYESLPKKYIGRKSKEKYEYNI